MKSLSPKQSKAILLLASGKPRKEVAVEVGISSRQLDRYIKDENFNQLYDEARKTLFRTGVSNLCLGIDSATNQLNSIIDNSDVSAATKVRAIDVLLRHASTVDSNDDNIKKAVNLLVQVGVIPRTIALSLSARLEDLRPQIQAAFALEGNEEAMSNDRAIALIKSAILGNPEQ